MPINQLFKNMPERSFVITLINLYGIEDFDDDKYFTKKTLEKLNTIEKKIDSSDKRGVRMDNHIDFVEGIYDKIKQPFNYILNKQSDAVDAYLNYLDGFPNSIYYDMIRKRLRKIAL